MSKSKKPTLYEFVKNFYGLSIAEYERLNDYQKKAVEITYKDRYGSIKWF